MFSTHTFQDVGVHAATVSSLARAGITTPTNAQATVIPLVREGLIRQLDYAGLIKEADDAEDPDAVRPVPPENDVNDVLMIGAETGCGKTLSYLVPYVDAIREADVDLKAVILAPTRELCHQVESFLKSYFEDPPRSLVLAGGNPPDVSNAKDIKVVIATPGALLNYFRFSEKHDTSDKYIVVDEADMLLTGGFLKLVERVLDQPGMKPFATRKNGKLRKENRNRLLFVGATYPHWTGEKVRSIVTWMKRRYPGVTAVQTEDIHKRSEMLQSRWWYVKEEEERLEALEKVLREADESEKVMVFASKAGTVARICETMEARMGGELSKFGTVIQLHKLVHGKDRTRNLDSFKNGSGRLLFCTDLAARGLDLGDVSRVVEYEFSGNVVGYLHRIGRTARAGKVGKTEHFYDDVTKPLVEAIRERADEGETVVEGVFSRKRSFRRKLKKRIAEQGVVEPIGTDEIDVADEEEQVRFRGEQ